MRTFTTLAWAAVILGCTAGGAAACPACYGSAEKNVLDTYYLSTVVLSLLPFGIVAAIASLGWVLARAVSTPGDPADDGPPRRPPGLRAPAAGTGNRATRPADIYRGDPRPSASRLQTSKSA
jgi:hypothetical protein